MYRVLVDGALFCDSRIEELAIINPVIKNQANNAGSFTFTVSPEHPKISLLKRRISIISVWVEDDSQPTFQGIITEESQDFLGQKSFTCESELTYLNDSIQRQAHIVGLTARQLLETYINVHNSQVEAAKRFTVGQVTVVDDYITCFTNYQSTMTEIKEDLIDDLGGYLRVRYDGSTKYLDLLADSPHTSNQVIRLGENLLDYNSNIDNTDIATAIIPLGESAEKQEIEGLDSYLTIKGAAVSTYHAKKNDDYVSNPDAVVNYGWISKTVSWNDVTTQSALLSKAEKYLTEIQFENVVLKISAVDYGLISECDRFRILDKIRVVSKPHGMDRYFMLTEQTINLNEPDKDTVVLGSTEKLSMSAKANSSNAEIMKRIEQMPTSAVMKAAIDNATALITGAEGGYVVLETDENGYPKELKIQDALENPTKIWRWNLGGLGYSKDGGKTYGTAITMDGAIVADYITAGTMHADRIKGGSLTLGGQNNANGQLVIKNASNATIGTWNKDGLNVLSGSIKGSTIALGGANNTDGTLTVKDASNNTVGTWTKDGINLILGTIGGLYITNSSLSAYNNKTEANSMRKVVLSKYVSSDDDNAFAVYTRNSTSEDWSMAWGVNFKGNATSRQDYNASVVRAGVIYGELLYISGKDKNRIIETKTFGYRTQGAYETPTPYFGDIGEGTTDENGECYVAIDSIFLETVDTTCKYQVFLQEYGDGKLYVDERKQTYFVVKGTPNLSFGYEIKAIQFDCAGVRFPTMSEDVVRHMEEAKNIDNVRKEMNIG